MLGNDSPRLLFLVLLLFLILLLLLLLLCCVSGLSRQFVCLLERFTWLLLLFGIIFSQAIFGLLNSEFLSACVVARYSSYRYLVVFL